MPSRSHNRSCVHAHPNQREATISTSPPRAAAAACSWVSYREIDATCGCRSLCASCRYATTEPSLLVRRLSRRYMATSEQQHPCSSTPATRHQSCAYKSWRIRGGRNGVTSANATDQGQMCLRTAEVRSGGARIGTRSQRSTVRSCRLSWTTWFRGLTAGHSVGPVTATRALRRAGQRVGRRLRRLVGLAAQWPQDRGQS